MRSAFGSKRRARKIEVNDDEEGDSTSDSVNNSSSEQVKTPTINTSSTFNSAKKPLKKSALRQSIAFDDDDEESPAGGPAPNKPSLGRSISVRKKKAGASRLSFGPGEIISGDAAEALEDNEEFTPKKTGLGRRVTESNATRSYVPYNGRRDEDDDRPSYSKDYLEQLKSSTPTAPKDLQHNAHVEDETSLDASELEGAMIVDLHDNTTATHIPTEAEIREKKERRARLAHEQDFISLNDLSSSSNYQQLSLLPRKKKEDTRLVREDEDLGEGFDEFVQDGRVALGRKQEREERKRQKKEMADMIMAAEGNADEQSDDSEAERRAAYEAAYEAAQTRAGMDGLHKPGERNGSRESAVNQIPSKITPLPVLTECLARLQSTLSGMELELAKKRRKLDESKKEKVDIGVRETEVQELLKQAGARYAALKVDASGVTPTVPADPKSFVDGNVASPMILDRGLESFGNTPTVRRDVEDMG